MTTQQLPITLHRQPRLRRVAETLAVVLVLIAFALGAALALHLLAPYYYPAPPRVG